MRAISCGEKKKENTGEMTRHSAIPPRSADRLSFRDGVGSAPVSLTELEKIARLLASAAARFCAGPTAFAIVAISVLRSN